MTRPPDESAAGKGGTKEVYGVAANMKEKLKNSALVRMFRSGPKEEEPPVQPEAREEPAPEVRDGPPPPSRHELQLPEGQLPLALARRTEILTALESDFSEIALDLRPRVPID